MDPNVIVTIGMPVFNASKYIRAAIKSILKQEFSSFELLIIDDASTDDTITIIKEFSDPRLRLISGSCNLGIAFRLNQLIHEAKGKYFCRMDGDDIMFPNRLKCQLDIFDSNSELDLAGSSAVIINERNTIMGIRRGLSIQSLNQAIHSTIFIHPTIFGKTEWFKKFRYDINLSGTEDYDLYLRSFNSSKFRIIDEPLIFYRDTSNFKLKTYLNRQLVHLRTLKKNQKLISNKIEFNKVILTIIFKIFISILLKILGLDFLLITRRNAFLSQAEKEKYAKALHMVIS